MEGGGENIFFIITWSRLKTEHPPPIISPFVRAWQKKELDKTSFLFRDLEKGKKWSMMCTVETTFLLRRKKLGAVVMHNMHSGFANLGKKTFSDFARIAIRRCDGDALLD